MNLFLKADILSDPSLAFGEGYMTKKIEIVGSIEDVVNLYTIIRKAF